MKFASVVLEISQTNGQSESTPESHIRAKRFVEGQYWCKVDEMGQCNSNYFFITF
jgi:hypothetical protein